LAYLILGLCAAGVILFGALAIGLDTKTRAETTRLVFVSVLPLFGTWVGLVLAYYYGKENLKAATASTETLSNVSARLAGIPAAETPVREVMIQRNDIKPYPLTSDEDANIELVELGTLWKQFQDIAPNSRLPCFAPGDLVRGIVHKSLLDGFAARQATDKAPENLAGKTIADLSADEKRLLTLFAIIALGATVDDARMAIKAAGKGCNDVFVTATGAASSPVIGWLTNTQLAGLSD